MPTFAHDELHDLAARALAAAGTPGDIADRVAGSLVDSNLKGVDSHGILRLPVYLKEIADGFVAPAARPALHGETAATAQMRGGRGFGIFAMEAATELAVAKAKAGGVAAVGLSECSHTGRIGQFTEQAARYGCFAQILGGGAHVDWSTVAPFGGAAPVMSTNPYSFAMPGGKHGAVVADFATSAVSRGKILVHQAKGMPVPEGWLLDRDGRATTDPNDLDRGGMQLPAAGHKGYGMGLIAELLCYAMVTPPPDSPSDANWLILAVDIAAFRAVADYAAPAEAYLDKVKATRPAEGFAEVLLPGEPERRTERARRENGIELPEATWRAVREAVEAVGVSADR